MEEDQSASLHCYEVDAHNYGELSAEYKTPTATHSILAIEGCRKSMLWEGLPGMLNWVADFFRCSTRTLVISCVLMSVILGNTDPSPSTLQQKATEGHYVDVLVQIYKLPVSKFRHSHHMVVGAADVSCDCNQHFCGETGEDRDELHSEPRNPDRGLKFLDLRSDDYEGSVHHHVSHSRDDIGNLQKHKTRIVNATAREPRTLGYSPRHQCHLLSDTLSY